MRPTQKVPAKCACAGEKTMMGVYVIHDGNQAHQILITLRTHNQQIFYTLLLHAKVSNNCTVFPIKRRWETRAQIIPPLKFSVQV
jgi:hypothetical protein